MIKKEDDGGGDEMYAFIYITFRPHPVVLENIFICITEFRNMLSSYSYRNTNRQIHVHLSLYLWATLHFNWIHIEFHMWLSCEMNTMCHSRDTLDARQYGTQPSCCTHIDSWKMPQKGSRTNVFVLNKNRFRLSELLSAAMTFSRDRICFHFFLLLRFVCRSE